MKPTRKGQLVQFSWGDWQYGPGQVMRFLGHGVCLVKWPRKGRKTQHHVRYLRRVDA